VTPEPAAVEHPIPSLSGELGHRERLLAAMAQSIVEKGFANTTVADVVRLARTSRRTFYEHFEDREACFIAVLEMLAEQVIANFTAAVDTSLPWEEQVDRGVAAHLSLTSTAPELMRSYIRELAAVGERGVAHQQAAVERFAGVLIGLVADARAAGAPIRELDRETAFLIVAGLRELAVAGAESGRDLRELQQPVAETIKAVLRQ
jgi:AcrR family transcriptional regulator